MKKLINIFIFTLALIVASCSDDDPINPPTSAFSFSIDNKTVTFTNASNGADSYSWNFGDGNTSTEMNPVHEYSDFGSFDVMLSATNAGGSDSRTITVDLTSVFQNNWTVNSALQTSTSDFSGAGGSAIVTDTELDNAQANTVLSYVFGELNAANTNALLLSLEQGGAVKLDGTATDKSTWEEIGGELNIDSSVSVVKNNSNSIVGVLNNDGTITITIGSLGLLTGWPAEFHIGDPPGQPAGSGAYITSVTSVDSIVIELSVN